jgi:multidrug resistance efflux pump
MKRKKVLTVLIASLTGILGIVVFSYISEVHSQKLPATVSSSKVIVSSEVDGVIARYYVSAMQEVKANDLIAEISNVRLQTRLDILRKEKRKYEELIDSAARGDILQSELNTLEEDIEKYRIELEEARQAIGKINEKLKVMEQRYRNSKTLYEANLRLHESGILNNADFEKAGKEFWEVHAEYQELKGDSLTAAQTVRSSRNIINLLKARKKILGSNNDLLASKHMLDMKELEADLNDLEAEVKSLKVYAPVSGIVTDLNLRPGEMVEPGIAIAEIADLNNVWIMAYGTSLSRQKVKPGQQVRIYSGSSKKLRGRVVSVSPVMEKVRSLSTTFETANTYTKIEIRFDDAAEALKHITPGERLFVRVYFN